MKVGDKVFTSYSGCGQVVTIVDIDTDRANGHSQTGIMYRVEPNLRNGTVDSWYDSAWFRPLPAKEVK